MPENRRQQDDKWQFVVVRKWSLGKYGVRAKREVERRTSLTAISRFPFFSCRIVVEKTNSQTKKPYKRLNDRYGKEVRHALTLDETNVDAIFSVRITSRKGISIVPPRLEVIPAAISRDPPFSSDSIVYLSCSGRCFLYIMSNHTTHIEAINNLHHIYNRKQNEEDGHTSALPVAVIL